MTDTQPFMDEAANLFWQIAKDAPTTDENGDACWSVGIAREIIATALFSVYQRGREEERERATKIMLGVSDVLKRHLIDKATPELLDALADAMNAASDEMEAEAAIRSRTTEG